MEEENKIAEEQDDNIYVYNEEDDCVEASRPATDDLDDSGPNYSQVTMDDISEVNLDKGDDASPFLIMLKVLLNPIEGWKALRRSKLTTERVQNGCFYPILAFYAISKFTSFFYKSGVGLSDVLVSAVTGFVSFFFGYFCILLILKAVIPKMLEKTSVQEFAKLFVMISLSTLCLFFSMLEIFPMLWAILIFFPMWTIYVVCRGARFFKFPDNRKIVYTGLLCVLTVGVPALIDWGLGELLPK